MDKDGEECGVGTSKEAEEEFACELGDVAAILGRGSGTDESAMGLERHAYSGNSKKPANFLPESAENFGDDYGIQGSTSTSDALTTVNCCGVRHLLP